jgi:squalene synthase HpnC
MAYFPWLVQAATRMSVNHYENFPVASLILPGNIRADVINLYRFARAADDIADEGDLCAEERRRRLGEFRQALTLCTPNQRWKTTGDAELDTIFIPLAQSIERHQLPAQLLGDLLTAFEQDTVTNRYATEDELMRYCHFSANPVGRLMLYLFKQTDVQSLDESDAICTALQRINFLQDVAIDLQKDRIYLPSQALDAAGVTPQDLHNGVVNGAWRQLMAEQIGICRSLMTQGQPLGRRLRGRIALEIRLIIAGGLRILEKIEAVDGDVFRHRPTLTKRDWIALFAQALRAK